MHNIAPTSYGFRITASGIMDESEAQELCMDLLGVLSNHDKPFSLIVDIRKLIPIDKEAAKAMTKVQELCKRMSLLRAAIVVESPVVKSQAKQVGVSAETTNHDRVIDARANEDWEEIALKWAADGVDPDYSERKPLQDRMQA